ncbi:serine hydrolase domain-containing protein [Virgisporangium ochraceum]|uniref:Serine hydrolase n=1 Tax=Virgisporangium ochraceum TaxID=65505 RepID=A0A8J3ZSI1_9ACTN|nr:serine hydrolase domain-containing protein [Virgisporangium ochraceum]GIJ66681.1 serine hydrolase [Virgisporangium ochraceum]
MSALPNLQRWLDGAATRHDVPGAAIAVGVGDVLVEAATGVVNRGTGVGTTTDTLFQIGSVTKVWTAALVMQLVDEGLVDLDAPVRRYLPEFGVLDAAASASVTVRQLLSHTGGFDGDLFEDTGRGDDAVDRLLAFMRTGARQVHPPGELFSYCNAGYNVLGALVSRLRGGTWESVLRERLIGPLGATHMALFAEEAILFRAAVGHLPGTNGGPQRVTSQWQIPRSNAPAGATPCAAPRELVRFGRMFLADGVAADGTRVLPAGTFAAMCEPQVTLPWLGERYTARWGLGFMLFEWDGVPVVGHDGGTIGQGTCWRVVPDRDVVVAVTVNGGAGGALIDDVLAAVLAESADLRLPPRVRPPAEPVPVDPAAYVGRYSSPAGTYEIVAADGGLDVTTIPKGMFVEIGEEPKTARYVPLGDDRFVGAEPDEGVHPQLVFIDDGRYLYNSRAMPRETPGEPG